MTSTTYPAAAQPAWRVAWASIWRLVLALLLGTVMFGMRVDSSAHSGLIEIDGEPVGEFSLTAAPVSDFWLGVDLAVGLLVCGLMLVRHRWPLPVAAVAIASGAVSSFGVPASVICIFAIASRRRPRDLWVLGPLFVAAMVLNMTFWPAGQGRVDMVMSIVTTLILFGAAWAWGSYRGARRELVTSLQERAITLEREQHLRVAQARTAERARIAQEMHDVLAHRISLIAVHANALAFRSDLPARQVSEHAGVIRDNADHAVAELREVLGVLRGGDDGELAPPQPTLDQLPALLDDAQRAGTRVVAQGAMPEFDELSPSISRTAYRVIQECLTNARKHATGRPVTLQISGGEGRGLDIVVSNPLPGAGAEASIEGTGTGLLGLAERVGLAGGTLEHALEDGFFVVRAHLPWSG